MAVTAKDASLAKVLLFYILRKEKKHFRFLQAIHGAEFVSRRGPLSRLAAAPFDAQSHYGIGQTVACVKYKGSLALLNALIGCINTTPIFITLNLGICCNTKT